MRLRYLHLGHYPPIKDMAVRFASGSPLQRECAIRFVVGVNGSGKSNLLRAVAEVFLALSEPRIPPFPVSLIYELGVRGTSSHRSLVLDCPSKHEDPDQHPSLWIAERYAWPDDTDADTFESALLKLRNNTMPPEQGFNPLIAPGTWPARATTPPTMALPSAVLAYTTGAMQPWQLLWSRSHNAEDVELVSQSEDYDPSAERPAGWTAALEIAAQTSGTASARTDETDSPDEPSSSGQNQFRRPILLTPALLKCALLAVALPQAFLTLHPSLQESLTFLASRFGHEQAPSPLQALLERGGWHYLVSVAFRCRLQPKTWRPGLCRTAHDWLLCAGEVIAEPHPTELRRTLFFDLKGAFNSEAVETLLPNSGRNQGEALRSLLGDNGDTPAFKVFMKLVELHQDGLFDDLELYLRRQPKPGESADKESQDKDIGVLRYEELSDGEQMVLGRMALFHLLEGQQDALLLLDEPETHFNDKWKREIVDIIDGAIGNTANDVLISTHSAIVLSDVFNDEIVMVQKTADGSTLRSVSEQTFATDPSALMMTVFEADDSIGKRAQEFIEEKLRHSTGTAAEIVELERLIARMGSGFYRSELRTLLNQWKGAGRA
jgi:ABC-type cobalamin/Fe3+-siderophores transport system ATPase subunit